MNKSTARPIEESLNESGVKFAEKMKKEMKKKAFNIEIKVVDYGNHHSDFKGGVPLRR